MSNLLLFYTNITRQSSEILSEQKANIKDKLAYHDKIKLLGYQALESIDSGCIDDVGNLLAENWEIKKQLASNITNQTIDRMYELGMEAGAIGGKVAGAVAVAFC